MKTKRFFSIILAVLMLDSIFSGLTVSAAGTDSESGTSYSIMFSDNTGNETCALMFNTNCIGDTAYVTSKNKEFENQVDSSKHSYQISWRKMLINMVFH